MKRFALLLMLAGTAAAQETPFFFDPNHGSIGGGDKITITAIDPKIDFTSTSPKVLFDGIAATNVTVLDSKHLTAVSPPHSEGAIVIQVDAFKSFPYFAYIRPREATLIPVANETNGAFGARWTTDIAVFNDSDEAVSLTPDYCFSIGAYFPCQSDLVVPPHASMKIPPRGFPELYLAPPSDVRDKLHFSARVRDVTRDDAGTQVPIVPLSQWRRGRVVLNNVPVSDRSRSVLRIYDYAYPVTVRIYDAATGAPLLERDSGFRPVPTDAVHPFNIAFFDILSGIDSTNVRIEIDEEGPALWAMLTLTDNATQRVTIITSQ